MIKNISYLAIILFSFSAYAQNKYTETKEKDKTKKEIKKDSSQTKSTDAKILQLQPKKDFLDERNR